MFFIAEEFVGDNICVVRGFLDVFPEELPGYHQIGKLSLSLISYLGLLLFLNDHIGCP
jgi:hypothetical protein